MKYLLNFRLKFLIEDGILVLYNVCPTVYMNLTHFRPFGVWGFIFALYGMIFEIFWDL